MLTQQITEKYILFSTVTNIELLCKYPWDSEAN